MCIYRNYCLYHHKSTELVSLYTLDIELYINIIIINVMVIHLFMAQNIHFPFLNLFNHTYINTSVYIYIKFIKNKLRQ